MTRGGAGPLLMGIVNVTPDSFSDGGVALEPADAVARAQALVTEGADILDIGGESTRPGAPAVHVDEELARVLPVLEALSRLELGVPISIDTTKAEVARQALAAGVKIVNDVSGLRDPEMLKICADAGATVVIMHMRGTPATMQEHTTYGDVVDEVCSWLADRAQVAVRAGVAPENIVLDPGLGFGKELAHNPRLIAAVPRLSALGHRVLIGASRKRFIGELTGEPEPSRRVAGSIGAALAAARCGADWLRVHDVAQTRAALSVFQAVGAPR